MYKNTFGYNRKSLDIDVRSYYIILIRGRGNQWIFVKLVKG
jgi:hypothetical protein